MSIQELLESKIAFIGAGRFFRIFMEFLFSRDFGAARAQVLGVADVDPEAAGLKLALDLGLFTTTDYTGLYRLEGLGAILELTRDPSLAEEIRKTLPPGIRLIDHFEARSVWDFLQVEDAKHRLLSDLEEHEDDPDARVSLINRYVDSLTAILKRRNDRSREIERELVEQERAQSQIIQGSTIASFVINKEHIVTHWNKAMERLSGCPAHKIVGSRRQWTPFYEKERPTMADVILDQSDEMELMKLYGSKWRKSALIEGAYEAEDFFPSLGGGGKWCFFTAAPIKAPGGRIVGAIETLQDVTEDKYHARELGALCSIYTALAEIKDFLEADGICLYLKGADGNFYREYKYNTPEDLCDKLDMVGAGSIVHQVAHGGEPLILEDAEASASEEALLLAREGMKSLAYVPITAKQEKALGVLRIGSRQSRHISADKKSVLELLGNRIGVTIENAMLQEQYIKSEEKYRSLFNNDPNPIFILGGAAHRILDTNQTAQDCYGYERDELLGTTFLALGDADDTELALGLERITAEQSLYFSKKRHYRKGRRLFYVNINVSQARYGERTVLIATTTDITESIERETQLIQAGKMTTLGVMAAGMAHEINQPLNVIQICADFFLKMLNRGQPIPDADLRSMASDIVANVERAANVIKHVRDFARQSELVRSKVDINDPIRDVFKVLGHQLKAHRIDLALDLDPGLPPILADHNRLEQVFINLVTNAIDAMDDKDGRPGCQSDPRVLTIASFAGDARVHVHVSDTGVGMTEEVRRKIFEPFFTTKKVGKGTGLGISISYGIVQDYDGSIDVETEVGKGTTFKISFPAAE